MSVLNTLNEILRNVIAGREEAEKELDLVPIKVDIKKPRITRMELELAKKQNSEIAATAKALELPLLEECAKANVNYVSFIYETITNTDLEPDVVEPQDYAQTIKALLKEIHEGIGVGALGPQEDDPQEDNLAVLSSKGDVGGGDSVVASAGDSGGDVGGGDGVVVSAGDCRGDVGGGDSVVVSAGDSGGDVGGGDSVVVSAGDSVGDVGDEDGVVVSAGDSGGEVGNAVGVAASEGGTVWVRFEVEMVLLLVQGVVRRMVILLAHTRIRKVKTRGENAPTVTSLDLTLIGIWHQCTKTRS